MPNAMPLWIKKAESCSVIPHVFVACAPSTDDVVFNIDRARVAFDPAILSSSLVLAILPYPCLVNVRSSLGFV